jgi:hypothetical protein
MKLNKSDLKMRKTDALALVLRIATSTFTPDIG